MPTKSSRNKKPGRGTGEYRSVSAEALMDARTPSASLRNLERLDLELLLLYQEIAPTEMEINSRRYVFDKIRALIVHRFPEARVVPFGSCKTELLVPSSDIDISVQFGAQGDREHANKHLEKIRGLLSKSTFIERESLFHVRKSKIPILKLKDKMFGFRVDISINQTNGVEAAKFVVHALKERPYMKVFAILLKYFLVIRNLSDAATGGLNSYSQILLLLSFFQLHPLVQASVISPLKNIGVLFLDFFQFYGCDFPYKTARISVNKVGYVKNDTKMLSIEDPTDPGWDVAAVCRNSNLVLEVFRSAFVVMSSALKMETPRQKSLASLWFKKSSLEPREEEIRRRYAKCLNLGRR